MSTIDQPNNSKRKEQILWIARLSIVCALYVAITLACFPFSYGLIQFRFSEVLIMLVFFNPKYSVSLILGCFISNLFSFNLIDCIVGTSATALSCLAIALSKNFFISTFFPVIFNGIFVGLELHFLLEYELISSCLFVALGEFVCVTILGTIIWLIIKKRPRFYELIHASKNIKS